MKRAATWALYIVGTISIVYLALYAYAMLRGDRLEPGDPIKFFRKENAPSYSSLAFFPLPLWERVPSRSEGG